MKNGRSPLSLVALLLHHLFYRSTLAARRQRERQSDVSIVLHDGEINRGIILAIVVVLILSLSCKPAGRCWLSNRHFKPKENGGPANGCPCQTASDRVSGIPANACPTFQTIEPATYRRLARIPELSPGSRPGPQIGKCNGRWSVSQSSGELRRNRQRERADRRTDGRTDACLR